MTATLIWLHRLLWLALPVAFAPALGPALDARSSAVGLVLEVLLWLFWAIGLVALLVPRGVSLTVVRTLTPLALVVAVWSAFAEQVDPVDLLGVSAAALALVVSLAPSIGEHFIDGSSYGPERRLPLRPPTALLFGPVELAVLIVGFGLFAGPLLLAARSWILGAVALAVGLPAAAVALRSLHGLSRRWLVIVPGGVVVHDPLTLTDPVLLPRESLVSVEAAQAGTDATDLTQRAAGLAVEIRLSEPGQLALAPRRGLEAEIVETIGVLVTPTRPAVAIEAVRTAF